MKKTTIPSDEELIVAYKNGDKKAFDIFYKKYHYIVVSCVCKIIRDYESSKDLAQEAFVKFIIKYIDQKDFTGKNYFGPLLIAIARNLAFDYLREKKTKESYFVYIENQERTLFFSCKDISPLDKIIKKEEFENLNKSIEKLSQNQKTVLKLRIYQEYSFDKIAMLMGEKPVTLRAIRGRSIEILKKMMKK